MTLWTPSNLATCVGWWDASDTGGTVVDDGTGHCSQWNDKSANANNVAALGTKPAITASGINSLQVLTWDSVTNGFEKLSASGLPSLSSGIGMAVAAQFSGLTSSNCAFLDLSDSTLTNRTALSGISTSSFLLRSQGTAAATKTFSDTSAAHIFSGTISTSLRDIYIDGTAGTPDSTTQSSVNSTNIRIGVLFQNVWPWLGKFGELVLFSGSSTTDRQISEGYLAWKWGTQASLPVGHPYASAAPTTGSSAGIVPFNTPMRGGLRGLGGNFQG